MLGRDELRLSEFKGGIYGGNADAGKNISGRFAVELKSPVTQARANPALSGTLRELRFNR